MNNLNNIQKKFDILFKKKNILLALSGGIDSIVLLNKLIKYKEKKSIKIRAIHINYNSHKNSILAENLCKEICKKNKISLIIVSLKIINTKKYGFEGTAREIRYEIFKKHILSEEILITAHHLNDQCETFFLSLKRGSGIQGLSSMKITTKNKNLVIIRPMLTYTKEEIIDYARKKKLLWIEDESNKNQQFDRNFIRNTILSKICTRWPYFLKNFLKTSIILNEENKLIDFFLKKYILNYLSIDGHLKIKKLNKKNIEFKRILLKKWIFLKTKKNSSFNFLQRIYNEFFKKNKTPDKKIVFFSYEFQLYQDLLYCNKQEKITKNKIFSWKYPFFKKKLPNNLGLLKIKKKNENSFIPFPKKNTIVSIKFKKKGKINLTDTKKIKIEKIWQHNKIPPWMRNKVPLLFYDNILICGIGVFFTKQKKFEKKNGNIHWFNKIKKNKKF